MCSAHRHRLTPDGNACAKHTTTLKDFTNVKYTIALEEPVLPVDHAFKLIFSKQVASLEKISATASMTNKNKNLLEKDRTETCILFSAKVYDEVQVMCTSFYGLLLSIMKHAVICISRIPGQVPAEDFSSASDNTAIAPIIATAEETGVAHISSMIYSRMCCHFIQFKVGTTSQNGQSHKTTSPSEMKLLMPIALWCLP